MGVVHRCETLAQSAGASSARHALGLFVSAHVAVPRSSIRHVATAVVKAICSVGLADAMRRRSGRHTVLRISVLGREA